VTGALTIWTSTVDESNSPRASGPHVAFAGPSGDDALNSSAKSLAGGSLCRPAGTLSPNPGGGTWDPQGETPSGGYVPTCVRVHSLRGDSARRIARIADLISSWEQIRGPSMKRRFACAWAPSTVLHNRYVRCRRSNGSSSRVIGRSLSNVRSATRRAESILWENQAPQA
jgi:hypothetical protein